MLRSQEHCRPGLRDVDKIQLSPRKLALMLLPSTEASFPHRSQQHALSELLLAALPPLQW